MKCTINIYPKIKVCIFLFIMKCFVFYLHTRLEAPPLCYVVGMVCLVLLSSVFWGGGAQKQAPHINIYKYRYPDLIIAFGGQAFVWLCTCCC